MLALVYKQAFAECRPLIVTAADLDRGYTAQPCSECDGTGTFEGPEPGHHWPCVACKSSGRQVVLLV